MRSLPRDLVAAATLTVHLARSHGSVVEDFHAREVLAVTGGAQRHENRSYYKAEPNGLTISGMLLPCLHNENRCA